MVDNVGGGDMFPDVFGTRRITLNLYGQYYAKSHQSENHYSDYHSDRDAPTALPNPGHFGKD